MAVLLIGAAATGLGFARRFEAKSRLRHDLRRTGAARPSRMRCSRRHSERAELRSLAHAFEMLAGELRGGVRLVDAVRDAAARAGNPQLARLAHAVDRGQSVRDAAVDVARAESGDVRTGFGMLAAFAEGGLPLAEHVETTAEVLRSRAQLLDEVRASTAQVRVSAYVIALLPVGALVLSIGFAPETVATALQSPAARSAIGTGLTLNALAFLWIRRVVARLG